MPDFRKAAPEAEPSADSAILHRNSGADTHAAMDSKAIGAKNLVDNTNEADIIAPKAGTLKNLYAVCEANTKDDVFRVGIRKNGGMETIVADFAAGALTANDLVNTLAVAAGDKIEVMAYGDETSGTVTGLRCGFEIVF